MQITNEDDDMTLNELAKKVMVWAKKRGEPFTSSEAYEDMQDIDDVKEVSDAVGKLYRTGSLARKRIDNVRFSYALASNAPEGYEVVSSISKAEASKSLKAADEKKASVSETKPPIDEIKPSIDETPAPKAKTNDSDLIEGQPIPSILAAQFGENNVVEVPNGFVLRLQAPGGLVITITTPGA